MSNNQEELEEKWICENAMPRVFQDYPMNESSTDYPVVNEISSLIYPKGCYIKKNEEDANDFTIFFNTHPKIISSTSTTTTTTTVQNMVDNSSSTTPMTPISNSTDSKISDMRKVCRLMDRKY